MDAAEVNANLIENIFTALTSTSFMVNKITFEKSNKKFRICKKSSLGQKLMKKVNSSFIRLTKSHLCSKMRHISVCKNKQKSLLARK